MSLTWSTTHKYGENSLAQQFPSFQISAQDAQSGSVHVESRSPSGRTQEMSVVENQGVYTANFTPTEVGDWLISIMYDNQHIQGSPFNVRVYDAEQVKVFGLEDGAVGKMFSFNVETAGAGEGQLTVDIQHNGRTVPVQVQPDGRSRYRVSFTPSGGGVYTIRVHFAGMEVRGSPYTVEIVDSTRVSATGEGLSMAEVNQRASFVINTGGGTSADLRVTITSPRGAYVPSNVISNGDGTFRVEYTVNEVGDYVIEVLYHGKAIVGSPFRMQASDWSRITVSNLRTTSIVGKLVEFDIDATQAGSGNLEIMVNDGTIPCSVQNRGNRNFHASFMPKEPIPHIVQMRFNGRDVPNSPWRVDVRGATNVTVSGPGLQLVPVNRLAFFNIMTGTSGAYDGEVSISILSPSGRNVPCRIVNNHNGSYRVEYTPTEVGNHTTDVLYDGRAVPGSPFLSKAYETSAIVVSPIPGASVGRPVEFTIDVTRAGEGQLEIMVNQGSVPNTVKMLQKGIFQVTFTPRDPRPHEIDIKFNGELLPGCPINVPIMDTSRVTVQGDGLRQVAVNRQSYFSVNTQSAGDADMAVRVTSPTGELVPAKIVRQPDDDYKVEYSSKFTGRHTIEILYAGQPIMGSPFYVEIYDPNKIWIEGARSGVVGQRVEFDIIRHEAGKAELGLNITCPSGRPVQYQITPTPQGDHVTYTPQEAGPHQIYITYGGLEVPGCPLTQNITDATNSSAYGDGLSRGVEHQPAVFYVDTKGQSGDLFVQVDGPNSIAKYKVEQDNQGRHMVSYVPVEVGRYNIMVKWNGREIEGSPFHPKIVDPAKVYVVGGWESIMDNQNRIALTVNQTKRIEFDTSLAGEGQLTAEVRGPNGTHPFSMEGYGNRFTLCLTPQVEGEYYISLFWCELRLPRSPLTGVARSGYSSLPPQPPPPQRTPEPIFNEINHDRVVLTGRGLSDATIHESAEFVIDGTDAGPGIPDVKLTGVKADIDVSIVQLGTNKYRCMYVPQIPGAYLLNIMWSDRQVRGSPFKVNIGAQSDASKVACNGEGLRMGIMGREIKSTIDARRAGPGELTAHCIGPTKVAYCELFDHHDGTFTLNVKPQEPGAHVLQVKYGGQHVPGSPFQLKVSGAPDASKVRASGPGIEHGILATYRSHFICETRGAGAGQLTVRVRGPKGAFRVEMQRESQKDRTILCRYDPTEVGNYVLHIKWSGQHIPGSPFQVHIFDTKEELDRFISENRRRPAMGNASMTEATMSWGEDM